MSLELFHKVPAGAIETHFDEQYKPLFKRADIGKYLGIENIKHNFKDFPLHYTLHILDLQGGGLTTPLGRAKSPHDIFINLDGSMEIAVRSKKSKAVALVKWLTKKDIEKIQEEHQQAIEEKDVGLAHRDDQIKALSLQMKKNVRPINRKS